MQSPEAVVRSFFEATAVPGNFPTAMRQHFADRADWHNTGFPTAEGIDAILAMLQGFLDGTGMVAMKVELVRLAVDGHSVLTERIDTFLDADGASLGDFLVAGTLDVEDGRIVSWRDYWDPRPLLPA